MRTRRTLPLLLAVALVGAACSTTGPDEEVGGPVVVVTTTILGDVVSEVTGDAATVEVLMPIGADPHDFAPSSAQVAAINGADLVVANGLGLEEGLEDVLEAAADDGVTVLEVAPLVDPLPFDEAHEEEHHEDEADGDEAHEDGDAHDDAEGEGHDHEGLDPHVWMDPVRMAEVTRQVAAALAGVDPTGPWAGNAEAYVAELEALDAEIALQVRDLTDRKLVTNHESLGYFADRYDFEVVGVVIPGGSTLAEPSSAELAALVATMEAEGVDVVFAETTESSTLAAALADELGDEAQVVELFTGSLGEAGSGAESYLGMMRANADRIAGASG